KKQVQRYRTALRWDIIMSSSGNGSGTGFTGWPRAAVSQAEIGRRLSRDRSTIGRETGRNRPVRRTCQPVAAEGSGSV
ncbi:MAG: hypothetical protein ACREC0_07555, partial [Methylocella sp.]